MTPTTWHAWAEELMAWMIALTVLYWLGRWVWGWV